MDSQPEECRSSTETINGSRTWTSYEKSPLIQQGDAETSTPTERRCGYIWHGLSYIAVIVLTMLISFAISANTHIGSECSCSHNVISSTGNLKTNSIVGILPSNTVVDQALSSDTELQNAWNALAEQSDGVTVVVPEAFGYERGILPESPRVTRNGTSGFLVTLDSMHQAHCVDAAWRRLWFNHENDKLNGPVANYNISDEWYKNHITHCIKILKQSILCKMNMDMVMGYMQWNRSSPDDFIHFEKNHICKNYTKVLGWIKNEEVD